jgi:hypothetical protein
MRCKRFLPSPKRPDAIWGPPNLLLDRDLWLFNRRRRPEDRGDHSLPSNAKLNNECSYCSQPQTRHSMHKNNFIFLSRNTNIYILYCYVITLLPVEDLYGFQSCLTLGADDKRTKCFGGKTGRTETGCKLCARIVSHTAVRIATVSLFWK